MMSTAFNTPKKLELESFPNSFWAIWHNSSGEQYVDIEVEFARNQTPDECRAIIQHFVQGVEDVVNRREIDIAYINFFNPKIFGITFRIIELGRDRTILALLVGLRQQYQVIRVGNRNYELENGEA